MQTNAVLNDEILDMIADEYSEMETISAANDTDHTAEDGYLGTYQISYQISYMIS